MEKFITLNRTEGVDMGESEKMNLCRLGWMDFCVFFSGFKE